MKAIILCGLLGLASCLGAQEQKTPSYHIYVSVKGKLKSGQMISIFSCGTRKYASIYFDSEMTIPLANPLLPDAEGMIGFFIPLNEPVEGIAWNSMRTEIPLFGCISQSSPRRETKITGDVYGNNNFSSLNPNALSKFTVINVKTEPGVTATVFANGDIDVAPSLKCEKYQHIDHWTGPCGPPSCNEKSMICADVCMPPPPDKCVDDIHFVTEKEWQLLISEQRDILNAVKLLRDLNHINREEIDQIINITKKP